LAVPLLEYRHCHVLTLGIFALLLRCRKCDPLARFGRELCTVVVKIW
jgi:hypothetical protein